MTTDPRSYNHPQRTILEHADVDGVARAVLTLTKHLWVMTDRVMVLEAVLARHGLDLAEEVENFQPDAALQARLNERGRQLTSSILEAMSGIDPDSHEPGRS